MASNKRIDEALESDGNLENWCHSIAVRNVPYRFTTKLILENNFSN